MQVVRSITGAYYDLTSGRVSFSEPVGDGESARPVAKH